MNRLLTRQVYLPILLAVMALLYGCAANPVTGRLELNLISESSEIGMGEQNYLPAQQSQGGEYLIDRPLTAYVNTVGKRIAKVSDRPSLPYTFVVLNNSTPNAWALPGGKIAINRGLLVELKSEAELAAVLSHEIVHAAARHSARSMERGLLLQAGMMGIGLAASESQYSDILVGASGIGLTLINQKYSRKAELEADEYGIKYMSLAGYNPNASIQLQETFLRLSENRRQDWLSGLFASHPPSRERVEANQVTSAAYPARGQIGEREYQTAINGLQKSRKVYDAYDQGRKALSEKNAAQAMRLADEAIRGEPREALFYGLKGDVSAVQEKYRQALGYYDQAISRNDRFFRFPLQRGLVREKLGDLDGARHDLEQSLSLFPTAHAHYSLGNIGLRMEQTKVAMEHFRMAASSQSEVGKKAWESLARLELPQNPEAYIASGVSLDNRGYVVVSIKNQSPVKVMEVAVDVALFQKNGVVMQKTTAFFKEGLDPDTVSSARTSIGPLTGKDPLRYVRTKITGAGIAE